MKALFILSLILGGAVSPRAHASGAKPSLEVVVLGSGGPPAFGRAGSSYIVLVDGTPRILLDAGPGAFVRIGELHIDLQQVDIVLLTHLHIDHSGDLAAFLNARALTSDEPIKYRVFGPDAEGLFPKTSRFVELLVGEKGLFEYQKTFGVDETFSVHDLAIGLNTGVTKIVDENGLMIEEIATHHGDCPSVAYRITYRGKSVVFSGDMDASAVANLVRLAKRADLLVFNCAVLDPPASPSQLYELHTPPKKIGEAARDSGIGHLLLSHIAPDVEESKSDVLKSIHASFTGPVEFAIDRMRVSVGRISQGEH